MNKKDDEKLEKLVADVLKQQRPCNFSDAWKGELVRRIKASEAKLEADPEAFVVDTHWDMVLGLLRKVEVWLRRQYSILTKDDAERIMDKAFDIWRRKFDAEEGGDMKNPELSYLMLLAYRKAATYVRKNYPKNSYGDGQVAYVKTISLEEFANLEDTKNYFDGDESAEREELDRGFIDNNEMSAKPVKFGWQFLAYFSFMEVFRYHLLTERLVYQTADHKPAAKIVHVDGRPAYTEITQPAIRDEGLDAGDTSAQDGYDFESAPGVFEFSNTNNLARYYRQRWEILRSENTARWAELAVSKLRESGDKRSASERAEGAT